MQLPEIKTGAKRNSYGNYATEAPTALPPQSINLKLKQSEVSTSQLNPLIYQGKLGSMQDKSRFFSLDRYKNAYQLKINSSTAFDDGEHRQLKDILKSVMASAVVRHHPKGDKSPHNSKSPSILEISNKRSRADRGNSKLETGMGTVEDLKSRKAQLT